MTALTGNYDADDKPGEVQAYSVKGATTIYQGALVVVEAGGLLKPATDAAGLTFVGIAYEPGDNSGGADGAVAVRVKKRGSVVCGFTGSAVGQTLVGQKAYAVDDNTVSINGSPATHVYAGDIVALVGTDQVRLRIDRAAA